MQMSWRGGGELRPSRTVASDEGQVRYQLSVRAYSLSRFVYPEKNLLFILRANTRLGGPFRGASSQSFRVLIFAPLRLTPSHPDTYWSLKGSCLGDTRAHLDVQTGKIETGEAGVRRQGGGVARAA